MTEAPAFTCPCCGKQSGSRIDAEQGYCGLCHWFTGDDILGPDHLAEPCQARQEQVLGRVLDQLHALAGHVRKDD